MEEPNPQNLLLMHQFYSEEAKHQRIMMWETVKWFTPILTLIAGGWVKYFIDDYLSCRHLSICLLLLILSLIGLCLSFGCILLLRSFYRTNLKYITMFAKVEEELNIDSRNKSVKEYYPGDTNITWYEYNEERKGHKPVSLYDDKNEKEIFTSKKYVRQKLKDSYLPFKDVSIFCLMKCVFYLFIIFFIASFFMLIFF